jgi:hypothetical protein
MTSEKFFVRKCAEDSYDIFFGDPKPEIGSPGPRFVMTLRREEDADDIAKALNKNRQRRAEALGLTESMRPAPRATEGQL